MDAQDARHKGGAGDACVKQPRIPEYREGESIGAYLRTLILFLKDFCQEAWTAHRQNAKAIRELQKTEFSQEIALLHAGNDGHESAVRKHGGWVSAQLHIGISRYPQSDDDGYVIGMIPEGFRPESRVDMAGLFEQGGAPRSLAKVAIEPTGEIRAVIGEQWVEIEAQNAPAIVASAAYPAG